MELWKPCWKNLSLSRWILIILLIAGIVLTLRVIFAPPRAAADTTRPTIPKFDTLPHFPAAPLEKPARIAYAIPGTILWEGYDEVRFFTNGNTLRRVVVRIKNPPKRGTKVVNLTFTRHNIPRDAWVEWRVRYARLPSY